jgi:hypothetical protein
MGEAIVAVMASAAGKKPERGAGLHGDCRAFSRALAPRVASRLPTTGDGSWPPLRRSPHCPGPNPRAQGNRIWTSRHTQLATLPDVEPPRRQEMRYRQEAGDGVEPSKAWRLGGSRGAGTGIAHDRLALGRWRLVEPVKKLPNAPPLPRLP